MPKLVTEAAVAPASNPSDAGRIYVDTAAGLFYGSVGSASPADWIALNTPSPTLTGVTITQGTLTDPALGYDHTVTWNDGADTFTAIKLDVTNTASAAASLLADLQVGGVSKFSVDPAGGVVAGTFLPLSDDAHDLGSSGLQFQTIYAGTSILLNAEKVTAEKYIGIAVGDETTALTTGTAKVTFRIPLACTLKEVRASLTTVSSSGTVTVDINESGTSVLSTKLTIDASELTSETAAAAAVISDSALADDAEMTIDIDGAGTGAAGLKVWLIVVPA